MTHRETNALETFCQTCPAPEAVTTLLEGLGFHLSFQMEAIRYPAYTQMPGLPAQYHYTDEHGTQVIYLAGHDAPLDGERFPRHASRFWVYPGADAGACQRIVSVLATRWLLTWLYPPLPHALAEVARSARWGGGVASETQNPKSVATPPGVSLTTGQGQPFHLDPPRSLRLPHRPLGHRWQRGQTLPAAAGPPAVPRSASHAGSLIKDPGVLYYQL